MGRTFVRLFVLFVNDNGFIGDGDSIVSNVTKAQAFDSRDKAEKHRANLYNQSHGFRNTISILEWL